MYSGIAFSETISKLNKTFIENKQITQTIICF